MSDAIKRLVDLRGYQSDPLLQLTPEEMPDRLLSTIPGTPAWTIAPYEIRTVAASGIPGIAVGDRVLFSRVEKASIQLSFLGQPGALCGGSDAKG